MKYVPPTVLRRRRARRTVVIVTAFVVGLVTTNAGAQEVDCERVPYNERIILVCSSDDSPTPTTAPDNGQRPGPTATSVPGADDDDTTNDRSRFDDDASEADDDGGRIDRGDRGGRQGVDDGDDVESDDAESDGDDPVDDDDLAETAEDDDLAETAEDDDLEQTDSSAGDTDQAGSDADGSTASGDDDDDDDETVAGQGILIEDSSSDRLAIFIGIGALAAAGAAFFVTARRIGRVRNPASSDGE